MNIVERGRAFLVGLHDLAERTTWEWRCERGPPSRCPHCGDTLTCKWGHYQRRPWLLEGRQIVRVQRHRCEPCGRTLQQAQGRLYSEGSALLVRGGWYAREVRRSAIDSCQWLRTSTRRAAELLRSLLGRQERWHHWRPLDPQPAGAERCHLSASTIERWMDQAGVTAAAGVADQLAGVPSSGQVLTDGLWTRLHDGTKRVLLAVVDSVSGVIWPPVVVTTEATAAAWGTLFARAEQAGLVLAELRGLASDGAPGLESYRRQALSWVSHQRCVFHLWRGLTGTLRQAVAAANENAQQLTASARAQVAKRTRRVLVGLVRAVYEAESMLAARLALERLAAEPFGEELARAVAEHLEAALVHLCEYNQGLTRASPEWIWRDFRLRLSHGRNHGTSQRLERAALVWAISWNFEPAQERSERKRTYRHPGQSPLAVAGWPPGEVTYLDALAV